MSYTYINKMVQFSKQNVTVIFLLGMIAGMLLIFQLSFKDNENGKSETKVNAPKLFIPNLPETMSFAGEQVPLDKNEVAEALDRELIYNYNSKGQLSYILKLSQRYFPSIESELKKNNLPDDFKYLCVAESNLQNLTSSVGAKGFWQFMKDTGPGFGLEINEKVDERYDFEKSTTAACLYLKSAYSKFGNWTAAAASYNCGMGRYEELSTFQQTKNYYDLQLPEETNRYIFRILALKHLMENAQSYGFQIDKNSGYDLWQTKQISVSSSIPNLAQWALDKGTTYKMLKILNPWLRDKSLTVKEGKKYIIKLPQ